MQNSLKTLRFLLLGFVVLLFGCALWLGADVSRLKVEPFEITTASHHTLVGRVYTLPEIASPYPAVILCHGVSSSKDTMTPLAIELARRGIAAVTFDFGGYGESYGRPESPPANFGDAEKILAWVKGQPQFDRDRLGIAGHSMGGSTALAIAKLHTDLKTTMLLGIAGEATPQAPQNLFVGSGVYEELNPVREMRTIFADAVEGEVRAFQTVGDFSQGTARLLVFSPTSDHVAAPYDPVLLGEAAAWAAKSFQLSGPSVPLLFQWRLISGVLGLMVVIALSTSVYQWLLQKGGRPASLAVLSLFILGFLMLKAPLAKNGVMGLGATLLLGHFFYYGKRHPGQALQRVLLYGLLIYLALVLAIVANALLSGSLLEVPKALLHLPQFVWNLGFALAYDRFHLLKNALFSQAGIVVVLALTGLEAIRPGWTLQGVDRAATWLVTFIRQPLQLRFQQTSRKTLLLLPLLGGVMGLILFQQWQSGLLTLEAITFVGRLMGVFLLFPWLLVLLVVRSQPFKTLEIKLTA